MVLKSKKELADFIEKRECHINYLIGEMIKYDMKGYSFEDFTNQINGIQKFYEEKYPSCPEETQQRLRVSFWAFFSKLLMDTLGGELIIASKSDYVAGTPQLVNYGNIWKNGKRKWIGLGFDSWFLTIQAGQMNGNLEETVEYFIKKYS